MAGSEDVFDQAIFFPEMNTAVLGGGYAGGVLSAVLKYGQRVIKPYIDFALSNHSNNAAHEILLFKAWQDWAPLGEGGGPFALSFAGVTLHVKHNE